MINLNDFGRWEDELAGPDLPLEVIQEGEQHLEAMEPITHGQWRTMQRISQRQAGGKPTSLVFAQSLQNFLYMNRPEDRRAEVMEAWPGIDELADDVRGYRVNVAIEDSGISGDMAGYTIFDDKALVALRLFEVGKSGSLTASVDKETNLRQVGPFFIPVMAVRSLSIITKSLR